MYKYITIGLILLMTILLACDEEPVEVFPDYSSPAQTFWTFTEAGIINTLNDTLTEDFTFYFDPNDPGDHPPSWTKTEFVQTCNNMFNADIHDIDFTYNGDIGSPGEGETEYSSTIDIEFLLMVDEVNGYLATGEIDIDFNKTGVDWKISEIRDHTGSYLMTSFRESTTWGSILCLFSND